MTPAPRPLFRRLAADLRAWASSLEARAGNAEAEEYFTGSSRRARAAKARIVADRLDAR